MDIIKKLDKPDSILNLSNTKSSPKKLVKFEEFLVQDIGAISAGDYVSLLDEVLNEYNSPHNEVYLSNTGLLGMMNSLKGQCDSVRGFIASGLPVSTRMKLVAEMTSSTVLIQVKRFGVNRQH